MLNNNMLLISSGGGVISGIDGPIMTAPSGRKYYRHSSGMGSVMVYNDGVPRRTLVLDAKYRFAGVDMATTRYVKNISLPKINTPEAYYLNPDGRTQNPQNKQVSRIIEDAWLNENIYHDPNSARYNGNVWREIGSPAVEQTRSILVGNIGCDVPTINQALRIMCDGPTINSMDKTATSFPDMALKEEDFYWSSTVSDKPGKNYGYSILDCHEIYRTHYNGYGLLSMENIWNRKMKYVPVLELAV